MFSFPNKGKLHSDYRLI